MMRILNDVLSLQKIHEGKFDVVEQPMQLFACLDAVVSSTRAAAEVARRCLPRTNACARGASRRLRSFEWLVEWRPLLTSTSVRAPRVVCVTD